MSRHDDVLVAWLESGTLDAEGEAHLAACERCQSVLAEIDGTRSSLTEPFAWEEPDVGLEELVVAAVRDAAAGHAGVGPVAAVPVAAVATTAGAPEAVVDLDQRRRSADDRSSRGRAATWVAAAVAAAACVVTVLAIATRPAGDPTAAPADPFADAVVLEVTGTDLAPGLTGTVRMVETPSGVRIALEAPGLPRRAGADYYQAWLRSPDGVLVPIGTFHDADEEVWLWSGVPIDEFPTITVTEESTDNEQASSGRRVLAGSLPGTAPATTAPPTTAP